MTKKKRDLMMIYTIKTTDYRTPYDLNRPQLTGQGGFLVLFSRKKFLPRFYMDSSPRKLDYW